MTSSGRGAGRGSVPPPSSAAAPGAPPSCRRCAPAASNVAASALLLENGRWARQMILHHVAADRVHIRSDRQKSLCFALLIEAVDEERAR